MNRARLHGGPGFVGVFGASTDRASGAAQQRVHAFHLVVACMGSTAAPPVTRATSRIRLAVGATERRSHRTRAAAVRLPGLPYLPA